MNSTDARLAADRAGIADYRFVRHLGAGNHGVFYLAHRPERLHIDAEFVAVKVLSGLEQPGHLPPGDPRAGRVRRGQVALPGDSLRRRPAGR